MKKENNWLAAIAVILAVPACYYALPKLRERADYLPRLEVLESAYNQFAIPAKFFNQADQYAPPDSFVIVKIQNPTTGVVEDASLQAFGTGIYQITRENGAVESERFSGTILLGSLKQKEVVSVFAWLYAETDSPVPNVVLRYQGGYQAVSLAKNRIPWVNFLLAFVLFGATAVGVVYAVFTAGTFVEFRKQVERLTEVIDDKQGKRRRREVNRLRPQISMRLARRDCQVNFGGPSEEKEQNPEPKQSGG